MNGDSKELLKKLDTLAKKIDILTKVTAISVQKEKLLEKKQKEQIRMLNKLGFSPKSHCPSCRNNSQYCKGFFESNEKEEEKGKTDKAKQGEVEQK